MHCHTLHHVNGIQPYEKIACKAEQESCDWLNLETIRRDCSYELPVTEFLLDSLYDIFCISGHHFFKTILAK